MVELEFTLIQHHSWGARVSLCEQTNDFPAKSSGSKAIRAVALIRSQFLNFHFPLWPVGYSNLFFFKWEPQKGEIKNRYTKIAKVLQLLTVSSIITSSLTRWEQAPDLSVAPYMCGWHSVPTLLSKVCLLTFSHRLSPGLYILSVHSWRMWSCCVLHTRWSGPKNGLPVPNVLVHCLARNHLLANTHQWL